MITNKAYITMAISLEYDLILKHETMDFEFENSILDQMIEDVLSKKEEFSRSISDLVDHAEYMRDNISANDYDKLEEKIELIESIS